MKLEERLDCLYELGRRLKETTPQVQETLQKAYLQNQWFTPENSQKAIDAICNAFLNKAALTPWIEHYRPGEPLSPAKVGLVLAGNIPLVGFHDILCVFVCGHYSLIKLSEKDSVIFPYLFQLLEQINPSIRPYFEITERLIGFDAVIATGSNNSARYFESYFGKYPHIIRKNRNAIAVLSGKENTEELKALGEDIFAYFGLGCRSVSKLYVPKGYDFQNLLENFRNFKELQLHNKYKNNFDYNYTLYILNKIPHDSDGTVLLIEDPALTSRIACLHFETYENVEDLRSEILGRSHEIQCVVSSQSLPDLETVPPGKAQQPGLFDYADGVDTMQFLLGL